MSSKSAICYKNPIRRHGEIDFVQQTGNTDGSFGRLQLRKDFFLPCLVTTHDLVDVRGSIQTWASIQKVEQITQPLACIAGHPKRYRHRSSQLLGEHVELRDSHLSIDQRETSGCNLTELAPHYKQEVGFVD